MIKKPYYQDLLTEEYLKKVTKNRRYSKNAFARTLRISPPYLSEILHRKKKLSEKLAIQISENLKWDKSKTKLFLLLVRYELADTNTRKQELLAELTKLSTGSIDFKIIDIEYTKVISEWYHFAILELTELKDFSSDTSWISQKLKIDLDIAEKAIKRLEGLNFLEWQDNKWVKTSPYFTTPELSSDTLKEGHRQSIDLALKALENHDFESRDFSEIIMTTSPDKIKQAKEMMAQFRKELMLFLESGEPVQLYNLNMQFFRLDKDL